MEDFIFDIKKYFDKYRVGIGLSLIVLFIFLGSTAIAKGFEIENESQKIISIDDLYFENDSTIKDQELYCQNELVVFDIEGGVVFPGVYRLSYGSVVADGVKKAGGFSMEADRERVAREMNQAAIIGDNSKIYIFKKSDREIELQSSGDNKTYPGSTKQEYSKTEEQSVKININTASLSELDVLPGIGPAIAGRIIDWREANDGFGIIDDIKKVKGVGDSLFKDIDDLITVD